VTSHGLNYPVRDPISLMGGPWRATAGLVWACRRYALFLSVCVDQWPWMYRCKRYLYRYLLHAYSLFPNQLGGGAVLFSVEKATHFYPPLFWIIHHADSWIVFLIAYVATSRTQIFGVFFETDHSWKGTATRIWMPKKRCWAPLLSQSDDFK